MDGIVVNVTIGRRGATGLAATVRRVVGRTQNPHLHLDLTSICGSFVFGMCCDVFD